MTDSEPTTALRTRVLAALPSLTPAAARVANVALQDPAASAHYTVTELAEQAGTSEATVVRAARALGYTGYPELRLALAAAGSHTDEGEADGAFAEHIALDDPIAEVVDKLAALEAEALRTTAQTIDAETLEAVVAAVAGARHVDVYGVGASGLVARDLQQKLARVGASSSVHVEEHAAMTSAVLLGAEDVVIAVSHSGETLSVLEPVRRARVSGATTIALTNAPRSSLVSLTDHVLIAAGRESPVRPGAMASRTSQLLLVDCIFVAVAQRLGSPAQRALRLTHEALSTPRQRADATRRRSGSRR